MKKTKFSLSIILKTILAIGILYWLTKSNYLNLSDLLKAFHPSFLPLILLLTTVSFFLNSERFRHLLQTQNVHFSSWECWKLFMIGSFFNYVIPGGVGGDAIKAYYLKKEKGHESATGPYTVIFDRFIGLYALMNMALIVILLNFNTFQANPKIVSIGIFVFAIVIGLNFLSFSAFHPPSRRFIIGLIPTRWVKFHTLLSLFMKSFEYYSHHPRKILYGLILSVFSQVLVVFTLYLTGSAVGDHSIPLLGYFFVAPLGLALSALPIAPPGGVGIGQAAFLFLFNVYLGTKTSIGPTVVTIFQLASLTISLIGLYFYLARKNSLDYMN